jgi:hypothetical protein
VTALREFYGPVPMVEQMGVLWGFEIGIRLS